MAFTDYRTVLHCKTYINLSGMICMFSDVLWFILTFEFDQMYIKYVCYKYQVVFYFLPVLKVWSTMEV